MTHELTDAALVAKWQAAAQDCIDQPCDKPGQTVIAVPANELARLCKMAQKGLRNIPFIGHEPKPDDIIDADALGWA